MGFQSISNCNRLRLIRDNIAKYYVVVVGDYGLVYEGLCVGGEGLGLGHWGLGMGRFKGLGFSPKPSTPLREDICRTLGMSGGYATASS